MTKRFSYIQIILVVVLASFLFVMGCGFTTEEGNGGSTGDEISEAGGDPGSESGDPSSPDGGSGSDSSGTGDSGDDGSGSGSSDGSGSSGGSDPSPGGDVQAPSFAGLSSAEFLDLTSVLLTWPEATDDTTPSVNIIYNIYWAGFSGDQNFAYPNLTETAGDTSSTVEGLIPGYEYYFVVRAEDQSGNIDSNTIEKAVVLVEWKNPDEDLPPANQDVSENADEPSLAFNNGHVYVVWVEKGPSGENQTYVKRWTGGGSFEIISTGEGLNVDLNRWSTEATVAFKGDTLHVAWSEMKNAGEVILGDVYVKRLVDGNTWELLGGNLTISQAGLLETGLIGHSSSTIPETPHIAFVQTDEEGIYQLFVKKWDEGSGLWNLLAGPNGTGSLNMDSLKSSGLPILAYLGTDPYVTWVEGSEGNLYVNRWDGTDWVPMGEKLNTLEAKHHPWLAGDDETIYVSWAEVDGAGVSQIYVAQWINNKWNKLGGSLNINPEKDGANARVAISDSTSGNIPYASWVEKNDADLSQLYVRYWDGMNWVLVGGSLNVDPTGKVSEPHIGINGEIPYVTWVEVDEALGESPVIIRTLP